MLADCGRPRDARPVSSRRAGLRAQPFRALRPPGAVRARRAGARRCAYRALQRTVHPDRHAASDDATRRLALQAAARVNEAYRTLGDPVERARYLLGLRGVDAFDETDTSLDVDFLERHARAPRACRRGDRRARRQRALDTLLREVRATRRRSSRRSAISRRAGADRRRARARARAQVPRQAGRRSRRDAGAGEPDGVAADFRARPRRRPSAIAATRDRHRPRHDQLAGRHGARRRHRGRCCRTTRDSRSCRRSSTTAKPASRSATTPRRRRSSDPHNTLVSVKRFMGRGLDRPVRRSPFPDRFVDGPAWCG